MKRTNEKKEERRYRAHHMPLAVIFFLLFIPGVHAAADQAGWPKDLGGMLVASPVLSDLDGDGDFEVIIGSKNGTVDVLHGDGTSAAGWPATTSYSILSSPAIGDLDGDSDLEVIAVSTQMGVNVPKSTVYVWHHDGSLIWSTTIGAGVISSPALGDIDADGDLEIVVGAEDNNVYAWHHDGATAAGWPKTTGGRVWSSPALADLDRDGDLEVVVGSEDGSVYAWHHDGTLYWSAAVGTVYDSSPAVADIDGDGKLEVVIGSTDGLYALNHDGTLLWSSGIGDSSSPAIGDIDGDGDLEIAVGTSSLAPDNKVYVFYNDGTVMWSKQLEQGAMEEYREKVDSSPAIGDIDGDGSVEIIVATTATYGDGGTIYAWDSDGTLAWSDATSGAKFYMLGSSPAIGDIDGDGDIEVIVGSIDGKVYAWDMDGAYGPDSVKWGMFRHDARHMGTLILNNNLDIVQAQTDSALYLLGENVAISCRVQDYYGIGISADSVEAVVDRPDGSSGTVALQESYPGNYAGTFTSTLVGLHTATIYANRTGYAGASAGLTFNVTPPFWHYRLPVDVDAGASERTDALIDTEMNFTKALQELGISATFDINSPRVFEADGAGNDLNEVPSQFERELGEPGTTNIALGKTATASSEYSSSYSASKAIDGATSGYPWAGTGDHNDWLKVDLGEPTYISKIVMTGYNGKYYPRDFTIQVSADDTSYTIVREELGNTNYTYSYIFSSQVYGRYVKLDVTQNNGHWRTAVGEFEIYDTTGAIYDAPTNAIGNVRWVMDGTTPAGTTRYYHVYFDTLENGAKPAPDYGVDYSALTMPAGITVTEGPAEIVELPNIPPAASITSPASWAVYQQGDSITFTGIGTDIDGTITAYAWASSIDGALGSASSFGTASLSVGTHAITLTVTDDDGATGTAIVSVTVTVNEPPAASITSPIGGSVYQQGDSITFTGTGTDIDGTIDSYAWTSDLNGALSTSSSFSASGLSIGTHTITLTVTDDDGATGTAGVTIRINDLPMASITEPANGAVYLHSDTATFTGTGTDTDGTIASFAWTSDLDGALGSATSFDTADLSIGTHTITLTVTDNDGAVESTQKTIRINDPPTASITSPADGSVYLQGDSITFTGTGTDTDGTITAYAWTSSIDGALAATNSFSASGLSIGTHTITLTVTDNDGAAGTTSTTIRINDPPTASITSPANASVYLQGDTATFTGTGTDTDGTIAAYAWTSDLDGALSSTDSFNTSGLSIGTHTITLTVTDSDGSTATTSTTIRINDPPTASIILPGDGALYSRNELVAFEGTGTDTDGYVASYAWTSNIDGTLSTTTNSFSASGLSIGTHTITLAVTDNDGAAGTASVTIRINDLPTANITSPPNDKNYSQTDTATFAGTGTDTDGTIDSYAWTSSIDGALGSAASFSTSDLSAGTHVVTLTVTDNDGAIGTASININQTEYDVEWLMKNVDARLGSTVPIKFTVHSPITGGFVIDNTTVVRVYDPDMVEVFSAVYGEGPAEVRVDAIVGQYITNFQSPKDAQTGTYTVKVEFASDRPNTNFETTVDIHTPISGAISRIGGGASGAVSQILETLSGEAPEEEGTTETVEIPTVNETTVDGIHIITDYNLDWLMGRTTLRPGSTVPIKFTVQSPVTGGFVIDNTAVVRVYDPDMNGVFMAYYGENVRIDAEGEQYIANFQTTRDAPKGTYLVKVEFENEPDDFETTIDVHTRTSKIISSALNLLKGIFGR